MRGHKCGHTREGNCVTRGICCTEGRRNTCRGDRGKLDDGLFENSIMSTKHHRFVCSFNKLLQFVRVIHLSEWDDIIGTRLVYLNIFFGFVVLTGIYFTYYRYMLLCMQVLLYLRYCNTSGSLMPLRCRVVNNCFMVQVLDRTEG